MKNLRSAFTQGAGFVYRSIIGEDARIDPYNRERLNPTIKELLFCKNQHSKQNCIIFTAG